MRNRGPRDRGRHTDQPRRERLGNLAPTSCTDAGMLNQTALGRRQLFEHAMSQQGVLTGDDEADAVASGSPFVRGRSLLVKGREPDDSPRRVRTRQVVEAGPPPATAPGLAHAVATDSGKRWALEILRENRRLGSLAARAEMIEQKQYRVAA